MSKPDMLVNLFALCVLFCTVTAVKQEIVIFKNVNCGGENYTLNKTEDLAEGEFDKAESVKVTGGVWKLLLRDKLITTHSVILDRQPSETAVCKNKKDFSQFDLTQFTIIQVFRVGPADTQTAAIVLSDKKDLEGHLIEISGKQELSQVTNIGSLVLFGKGNAWKAYADKSYSQGHTCIPTRIPEDMPSDSFEIRNDVNIAIGSIEPDFKSTCVEEETSGGISHTKLAGMSTVMAFLFGSMLRHCIFY